MISILKLIFLVCSIAIGSSWVGNVCRGHGVSSYHTWLMALSIAGFIFLQFELWK